MTSRSQNEDLFGSKTDAKECAVKASCCEMGRVLLFGRDIAFAFAAFK